MHYIMDVLNAAYRCAFGNFDRFHNFKTFLMTLLLLIEPVLENHIFHNLLKFILNNKFNSRRQSVPIFPDKPERKKYYKSFSEPSN